MTPRGDKPQVRPADALWLAKAVLARGHTGSTEHILAEALVRGDEVRPAATDALIEEARHRARYATEYGSTRDAEFFSRIADALALEREAGKNLKRAYWNERTGHDTTREWAERAEAQVEALRGKAKAAKSAAAAPDYDEEAIRDALWAVVDEALASLPPQEK